MLRFSTILMAAVGVVALGWLLASGMSALGWFQSPENPPPSAAEEAEPKPLGRDEFAADRGGPKPLDVSPAPFDGERAMAYLKEICNIGPRISGSDGMKAQQEMLKKHFEDKGGKVELQRFKATQKSKPKDPVEMANMVVSFWPERPRRIILCSHYDTRPLADQEADMRKWREPFVSANDGGSGAAFLMELANHIKDLHVNVGVDFVLFDGEEYIWADGDKYFFGSEHFAANAKKNNKKVQYLGAVLLDMIAGKDAKFPKEPNSVFNAGPLVESVWKVAAEKKCNRFLQEQGTIAVEDDHIPLNRAGIPAIDIIDFSYKHWHKLSDTPANCAAEPMEEVSKVLSTWVQRLK